MCLIITFLILCLFVLIINVGAHSCGTYRIPYGIEIHQNGQPTLLCSRPGCFEKSYADCDEKAIWRSCDSNTSWVGGFDKIYGRYQPLYVQCCEFELLPYISIELYSNVTIKPGEYFEGEEIMDKFGEVEAFDIITNITLATSSKLTAYIIDIRRIHCDRLNQSKKYKPWKWP